MSPSILVPHNQPESKNSEAEKLIETLQADMETLQVENAALRKCLQDFMNPFVF